MPERSQTLEQSPQPKREWSLYWGPSFRMHRPENRYRLEEQKRHYEDFFSREVIITVVEDFGVRLSKGAVLKSKTVELKSHQEVDLAAG